MLSMRECSRVAGTGFAAFAALSHSIRSLNLSFCLAFSQPGMPHLATDQFVWSVLAPAVLQIMSDSKADRGSLDLVQAARRWEHYLIWQSWTSACASAVDCGMLRALSRPKRAAHAAPDRMHMRA